MAKKEDLPKLDDMIVATMAAMKSLGDSANNSEIAQEVIRAKNFSEEITSKRREGKDSRTYLEYYLAWARSYLKRVGALENTERGVWTITPIGRKMNDEQLAKVQSSVRKIITERIGTSTEDISTEDEDKWKDDLLQVLSKLKGDAFERLCQRLLREKGFIEVKLTQRSHDGGIDGIGKLRIELVSFHVLFQCKRWKGSVSPSVVRDFRGAMVGQADKGLIITTGTFTPSAHIEAIRPGAPTIDLIDGSGLCDLLKETKIGVKVKKVEEIEIDEAVFQEF